MSTNRQKFLALLAKWPLTFPVKEYDYGYRLRELLKNKNEFEEIFPGTPVENAKKIDALMRLASNSAKNQWSNNATVGACGFQQNDLRDLINQQFKMKEKKT